MISKKLLDYVAGTTNIRQAELVEKDLILHKLLIELSKDSGFYRKYVFKGGTCLIKCYLGYYRFSEDLDFTWIEQEMFENRSEKNIRKILSKEINDLILLLEKISTKLGMDFVPEKNNRQYIEFGGSNKFVTFKLWYNSSIFDTKEFVKIQVNYVEKMCYKSRIAPAKSLFGNINVEELEFLFPEAKGILLAPKIKVYDLREILIEKVRAILTRRTFKARDFVDVYVIEKEKGLSAEKLEPEIIDKTRFMLKYEKYMENLKENVNNRLFFRVGEEQKLLLKPLGSDFQEFAEKFKKFIDRLLENFRVL